MEIKREIVNGVNVLALLGRVDELSTMEVQAAFQHLIDQNADKVVLDLSGVEYISSSGLRVLLFVYRKMKSNGGNMRLCNLSPFVAEVFEVSNFTSLFDIDWSRDAALEAISKD